MAIESDYADLYAVEGPFVSAYLESPSDEAQAARELTLRWKNMRRDLAEEGADDETLAAMDVAVGVDTKAVSTGPDAGTEAHNHPTANALDDRADHGGGGDVLALVAAGGAVLFRRNLSDVAEAGRWRLGLLPWMTPALLGDQAEVPYVMALVDQHGAELHDSRGRDRTAKGDERVDSDDTGGGSQRRGQHRQVESWERNAKEVAEELAAMADRVGARLVAVGGDDRIVSLVADAVPSRQKTLVHRLEHGTRAAGGDAEALDDELRRLVKTVAAADTTEVLAKFREEKGQDDRAADGPARVVEALQQHNVETLLVHDDLDDERMAFFGPEPGMVALDRADLEAMGVEHPEEASLVDICVRAALGTGAQVRVVPASVLTHGLGAVLRFTDTPPVPGATT